MDEVDVTTDAAFMSFMPGRQRDDDQNLVVDFYVDKKLMGARSEEAKRPVYEDREYVRIRVKGQKHQVVVHEITDALKERFPVAYHRFLLKKPAPLDGMPIEQLPGVGPSQAEHLKMLALRTVEDVARVNDENVLRSIGMGARDLVVRAKAYLGNVDTKSAALQEKNAALQETIEKMNQRMAALEQQKPKQIRRRRRKAQAETETPA